MGKRGKYLKRNRRRWEEFFSLGRSWAELEPNVLILIFLKLGTMEVLRVAGSVCRSWRKVATQEPVLWRRIDMSRHDYYRSDAFKLIDPARLAIDRSGGRLEEFAAAYFADDYLLRYLCDRTSVLKKLNLISSGQLSAAAIAETAERQPLLEEIKISCGPFSKKLTEFLGTACPHLKSFELYYTSYNMPPPDPDNEEEISNDDEAFGIAKAMHKLHHLQLIGNSCGTWDNQQIF
ncbi:F-box family protein [Rhynchospora pubera]|uniref:F-box family protein n=1 Tax=Rhynchospora pubera TaxID=906938 RepID=A0AAV8GS12_9POAL|nr:F-box family protein [Rhynchospora pubera]